MIQLFRLFERCFCYLTNDLEDNNSNQSNTINQSTITEDIKEISVIKKN